VRQRNFRWIPSLIQAGERAERYRQGSALLLITGAQGAGRKRIANQLEAELFAAGRLVYFLGIGSVIYGLDADLSGEDRAEVRLEHIRRTAEVAHILLDAGVILLVTAVDLTSDDVELFRIAVGHEAVLTAWVGSRVTTGIIPDVILADAADVRGCTTRLKALLRQHGVIEE